MSITTILFDLDGTLLPMDQDEFVRAYFKLLAKKLVGHGYDPQALLGNIWAGVEAMVKNTGEYNNEEAFWRTFDKIYGEEVRKDIPLFEEYYRNEFQQVQSVCGFNPQAAETIKYVKEKGLRIVLATNPRKPNPDYYRDIIEEIGVRLEECLMVGNDVNEDMIAESLGMKVFLLTDCLINKEEKDITVYPNGDFGKLIQFIEKCLHE